jgi:hypothetical protein
MGSHPVTLHLHEVRTSHGRFAGWSRIAFLHVVPRWTSALYAGFHQCGLGRRNRLSHSSLSQVFPGSIHVSALKSVPKLPGLIIAFILLFTAISGLAEVTGDWGNDAVAYHLLGPKVWLRNGIIRPVPDNCHTAFPQIPETLFATLWSIGGSRAPEFSSFLTFGLLLAIAGSLAIRCGTNDTGAWWVAVLVSILHGSLEFFFGLEVVSFGDSAYWLRNNVRA